MIEFIEAQHIYLVDGVLTPSATSILKATIFKDKYKSIPDYILERAAHFGTQVHKAIEIDDYLHLSDEEFDVFNKWLRLQRDYNIKPIKHEQMIHYGFKYAGTLDMIGLVNGVECLLDIKTTYNLDIEYLSWQLSMYELAYGKRFDKLYAIWLPKRKNAMLIEIERKPLEDILKLIEVYYDQQKDN